MAQEVRQWKLELRKPDRAPALTVRADGEKVQHIVLNQLNNAVKFTPPGGVITLSRSEESGKRVLIRVSDTRHGIASDTVECVFHPFVQVDSTLTGTHEGTGLGLAISREVARGMGGDLTVSSMV